MSMFGFLSTYLLVLPHLKELMIIIYSERLYLWSGILSFIGGKGVRWSGSFFWNFLKSLYSNVAYDPKQNDGKFFLFILSVRRYLLSTYCVLSTKDQLIKWQFKKSV